MMRLIFILSFFAFFFSLEASDDLWIDDYKQAITEAKKQNKMVYMLITSNYCNWCKKFKKTTLAQKEVLDRLDKKYILLHLSKEMDDIPSQYDSKRVPKHYFLTKEEEVIRTIAGYWNKNDFFSFLDDIDKIQGTLK